MKLLGLREWFCGSKSWPCKCEDLSSKLQNMFERQRCQMRWHGIEIAVPCAEKAGQHKSLRGTHTSYPGVQRGEQQRGDPVSNKAEADSRCPSCPLTSTSMPSHAHDSTCTHNSAHTTVLTGIQIIHTNLNKRRMKLLYLLMLFIFV